MANVRTCVFFLVLFVSYRLVASQPTFGTTLWCNMFCGDDSDSSDDSEDYGFLDLFDLCYGCSSKSSDSSATTTTPAPQPVKVMIPPSTGLNLTMFSSLGGIIMDMVPWLAAPTTPAAATPAPTTAAPATTPAGSTAATTAAATTAKAK